MRPYRLIFYFLSVTLTGYSTAWRDAPFHYPSDFICRKSAERLDSMANKPSDPGSESVCKLQRSISDI